MAKACLIVDIAGVDLNMASKLIDLLVEGNSKFYVRQDGVTYAKGGLQVPSSTFDLITRGGQIFFHHDDKLNIGLGANTPPKQMEIGYGNIFVGDGTADSDATTPSTSFNVFIGTTVAKKLKGAHKSICIGPGT